MTVASLVVALAAISLSLSAAMTVAWMIWRRTGHAGWIDTTWTFAVGGTGAACALWPLTASLWPTARQLLVAALIAVWSLRLGVHVAQRTLRTFDDPRYAALVAEWGNDAPRRMFIFCQQQAWVTVLLVATLWLAAQNPLPGLRVQDLLAVALLSMAVAGESVADAQLRRFASDTANKGKVCDMGLWRWSRHPNYFFEWLGWCAYPLFAIDPSRHYPWGWLSVTGPICMYWLLAHVSGIPPLEQHMLRTRGDDFRAYQDRTRKFFPVPPL